jgi:site-specific recombinase XerD
MTEAPKLPNLVQRFFTQHLCEHKNASPCTITAYRDTFRLFFGFLQEQTGRSPTDLQITDLDAPAVLAFLDHIESDRHNDARSRNLRLSAIRSFFRFVTVRDPANLAIASRVLAIPIKRTSRPLLTYLTRSEIDALLAIPDRNTWLGSRDHALLLTMYNTGARASEITALVCGQIRFDNPTLIHIHGKGRKDRSVPLWPQTSRVLQRWFQLLKAKDDTIAFPSVRGTRLSADGLSYMLQHVVTQAAAARPDLKNKRVTPHVIRHTTAMHLLQAGVDIAVIALWLGHESIETTHGYVEADLEMKQRALDKLTPASGQVSRYKPDDKLLRFLASL